MHKLAKQREKGSKDLIQVKCIKDGKKKLFLENGIQPSRASYFDKLINEVSENTIEFSDFNIVNNNKHFIFIALLVKRS